MTLGWIKEDAEDAFWEGTDVVPAPHRLVNRLCPFCSKAFPDNSQLFAHLHSDHTRERPILLIRGQEPSTPHTIRYALNPRDVVIENTETVILRNSVGEIRTVAASSLGSTIAREPGFVDIELTGKEVNNESTLKSIYRIYFKTPSVNQYQAADRDFVAVFGRGAPQLSDIDLVFGKHSDVVTSDYVKALCEYVRGVLIKDGDPSTGVRPPYTDYHLAYMRALQILNDSPRPLSRLLAKTIRLALNDFSQIPSDTGFPHLDAAYATLFFLTGVEDFSTPKFTESRLLNRCEIYPLDAGTSNVIELAIRFSALDRWSSVDSQRAIDLANSSALGAYDRAKVLALWASAALRLADIEAAREPLFQLLSNDCFSGWAASKLGTS